MKVTKLGHCCLVVEDSGKKILTDPGAWTEKQNMVTGVDIILITHEHADHFHIPSVRTVLQNNPQATVITNASVGKILEKEGIPYQLLEHGGNKQFNDLLIEGFGDRHAEIYSDIPTVQNTGFMLSNKLFFPGDAFTDPGKPVEVLVLPVCGPWLHISESINYALRLKPAIVFPVHDEILKFPGPFHLVPKLVLEKRGIKFTVPGEDSNMEF